MMFDHDQQRLREMAETMLRRARELGASDAAVDVSENTGFSVNVRRGRVETIEQQVFQRRFGEVVRLEVQRNMPESMRQLLLEELTESETQLVAPLSARDVHDQDDLLELGDLLHVAGLDVPELRDVPYTPVVPAPSSTA